MAFLPGDVLLGVGKNSGERTPLSIVITQPATHRSSHRLLRLPKSYQGIFLSLLLTPLSLLILGYHPYAEDGGSLPGWGQIPPESVFISPLSQFCNGAANILCFCSFRRVPDTSEWFFPSTTSSLRSLFSASLQPSLPLGDLRECAFLTSLSKPAQLSWLRSG